MLSGECGSRIRGNRGITSATLNWQKLQWAKLITVTVTGTTAAGNRVDEGLTVRM